MNRCESFIESTIESLEGPQKPLRLSFGDESLSTAEKMVNRRRSDPHRHFNVVNTNAGLTARLNDPYRLVKNLLLRWVLFH
jgi:hypothetical protein